MRNIGDKVWVVRETELGYQVQYMPIIGIRNDIRGEVWLYFVDDKFGYETDKVYDHQEEAIEEIVQTCLGRIVEEI